MALLAGRLTQTVVFREHYGGNEAGDDEHATQALEYSVGREPEVFEALRETREQDACRETERPAEDHQPAGAVPCRAGGRATGRDRLV